jgi:hypothetical protein
MSEVQEAEAISARLRHLRTLGAEGFDGPGLRFIEGLLGRGEALDGAARVRLHARALDRLSQLETRLETARAEASAALHAARAAGADADGQLAGDFEAGDFARVVREAAGRVSRARREDPGADRARALRLLREARERGLSLPEALAPEVAALEANEPAEFDPSADPDPNWRKAGDTLSQALYREAAAEAHGAVAVARAADGVAEVHGPYNPEALAAQALSALEAVSPAYLRHVLADLEDLASLRRLPAPKPVGRGSSRK